MEHYNISSRKCNFAIRGAALVENVDNLVYISVISRKNVILNF